MRLLIVILLATLSSPAIAQTSGGASVDWHGRYEGFKLLFQEKQLNMLTDSETLLSAPDKTIVLLTGDLRTVSRQEWLRLRRYVAQGGALLVATEEAVSIPGVTSVSPGHIVSAKKELQYSGFEDCLQIRVQESELSRGISELIVNRSGWMTPPEDESLEWSVALQVPSECTPARARRQPIIVAGIDSQSDGVFLLCADHSIYSDGMLWHGENAVLAINTVDLLCRGERSYFGFFENGLQNGANAPWPPNMPGMPPQLPPSTPPTPNRVPPIQPREEDVDLETLVKAANLAIDEVQQSDVLNEMLRDRPRNMRQVAYLRTLLLILAIVALAWLFWRLFQQRLPGAPERQLRFMESMYGVVSASQVSKGELGPAAEVLARNYCRELTGAESEREWVKLTASIPEISALPRKLRNGLLELVRVATRAAARHMSQKEFQAIGQTIVELRARRFQVDSLFELTPRSK